MDLLILTGENATGKSTVGDAIMRRTGSPVIEIGDIIRGRISILEQDSILSYIERTIRQGQRLEWVKEAIDQIAKQQSLSAIVIGVRARAEVDFLRGAATRCLAVALTTAPDIRLQRWHEREGPQADAQQWDTRNALEQEWGLADCIAVADHVVDSSGRLDAVVEAVLNLWLRDQSAGEA